MVPVQLSAIAPAAKNEASEATIHTFFIVPPNRSDCRDFCTHHCSTCVPGMHLIGSGCNVRSFSHYHLILDSVITSSLNSALFSPRVPRTVSLRPPKTPA